MYVWAYVCMDVGMHGCMSCITETHTDIHKYIAYIYEYTHTHTKPHTHIYRHADIHTYTHACMHVYIHMHASHHIRTFFTCTHPSINAYNHAYMHTCTHQPITCMQAQTLAHKHARIHHIHTQKHAIHIFTQAHKHTHAQTNRQRYRNTPTHIQTYITSTNPQIPYVHAYITDINTLHCTPTHMHTYIYAYIHT